MIKGGATWAMAAVLVAMATGCAATPAAAPAVAAAPVVEAPAVAIDESSAVAEAAPAPAPEAAPEVEPVPTACAAHQSLKDVSACLPPAGFVKQTCAARSPDAELGLALFAPGTPWTRAWLASDVDAWNASGGFTSPTKVTFDEEVIVLARHAAPSMGGIVMTGAGANYDVLRSDGSCVSINEGELTTRRPPAPTRAPMKWHRLSETTRGALLESPKVASAHAAMEKACREDSKHASCTKAEKTLALVAANARQVRVARR